MKTRPGIGWGTAVVLAILVGLAGWRFFGSAGKAAQVAEPGRRNAAMGSSSEAGLGMVSVDEALGCRNAAMGSSGEAGASKAGDTGGTGGIEPAEVSSGEAGLTVNGQTRRFRANRRGEYPRVDLKGADTVQVEFAWPGLPTAARVAVACEDGGTVANLDAAGRLPGQPGDEVRYVFSPASAPGLYRVTLRYGSQRRQFSFWVGPEPSVVSRQ